MMLPELRRRSPRGPSTLRRPSGCCDTISNFMKSEEILLGLLRRVAARLWVNRALRELVFGLAVVLFSLIAFRLLQPALAGTLLETIKLAGGALLTLFCALVLWKAARPASTMQAAGAADSAADLKDELKSAWWFVSQGQLSDLATLQLARAADKARTLRPRALVPLRAPRSVVLLLVLLLALVAVNQNATLASRDWQQAWQPPADDAEPVESLRELLGDARNDPALEQMDQALAVFEQADATREALQRASIDARDAVDIANLRAAAAGAGLDQLAETLRRREGFEDVAKALEERRTGDAIALLEKLRPGEGAKSSTAGDKPGEGNIAGGAGDSEQLLREIEKTSRQLGAMPAALNQEAFDKVLQNIEDASDILETQSRVQQVNRRMNEFMSAASQRSTLTASRFGNSANVANPTSSPETGSTNMQGGTMFRQGAVARGDDERSSNEGNKAGSATGHSEADPLEGMATERLQARLQRETLRLREEAGESDPDAQDSWFYSPTELSAAETGVANVRGRDSYERSDVMSPQRVPLRQRQLVRDYFINLHESEKK